MSVQIGNTLWDRHTGSLTPARAGVTKKVKADGSVELHGNSKEQPATGTITTTIMVVREADAILLNDLAGAMVDQRIAIALESVLFTGVRVQSVAVTWQKVKPKGGREWLVTGTWTFAESRRDGDPKQLYVPCKVETCRNWGSWVEQTLLVCATACEVFGPFGSAVGNAFLLQTLDPKAKTDAGKLPVEVLGHYVRISLPVGSDLAHPTAYKAMWWGRIINRSMGVNDGRVSVGYSCIDLSSCLDSFLLAWYELNDDGIVADGTTIPPFNALPSGERSSGTPGPDNSYVHDRTVSAGLLWRAGDIAHLLVSAFNAQFPDGPPFTIVGQTTALDNHQPLEVDGSTVREQLGQLIARGIGARVVVDDNGNALIYLRTGVAASITAGGWTVPANNAQTTLDLHALKDLVGWNLDEDVSQVADVIAWQLGCPWYAISLGIKNDNSGEYLSAWDAGDEVTWNSATPEQRDNGQLAAVYRRFKLDPNWVGASYKVAPFTIDVGRTKATDATFGTQGENGEFSAVGNNRFPWAAVRFTRNLPLTMGTDWTQSMMSGGPGVDLKKPLDKPVLYAVIKPGLSGEKWRRLDYEIAVDDNYPAITLGRDSKDAAEIAAILRSGADIVVTIGLHIPRPWRVSWRRDPTQRLVGQERSVLYQRPDIEYWYLMDKTVVGIKTDGTPKLSESGVIGAKTQLGEQLLAFGRLQHENPQRGLTWTRQPYIDIAATTEPGAFITTVTLPYGLDPKVGTVRTVAAPIGHRAWNLDREYPSTTWTTTRLVPDIVALPKPHNPPPVIVNAGPLVYHG